MGSYIPHITIRCNCISCIILFDMKQMGDITFSDRKQWWRHQIETFSALLTLCDGESAVDRWISFVKPSDADLWCYLWSAPEPKAEANNRDTGDLRGHGAHYDVTVMNNVRVLHCACIMMVAQRARASVALIWNISPWWLLTPVACSLFTEEVNSRLAKRPLDFQWAFS